MQSFLVNGHLHAHYTKLSGWLGLPPCGKVQWQRILDCLEPHVTQLAEWSCDQIRKAIEQRGDKVKWVASFDGFYLTRGHYSNNSSATIHGGGVAWFTHRTKKGPGHNWVGTSGGAESDMFDEVLRRLKAADFVIKEIVTDKVLSIDKCHLLPALSRGDSNLLLKQLHQKSPQGLGETEKNKGEVSYFTIVFIVYLLPSFAVPSRRLSMQEDARGFLGAL